MVDLRSPSVRRLAAVAFAVYVLVLAGVAFLPLPGPPLAGREGHVAVNLSLSRPDLLGGWESRRNVLMTVPFGILLPLVVRWRYELMVLACVGVTLVIETGQLLGSLGAGWAWRAFDVDDLLNNAVGGLLGLLLTGTVLLLAQRRAEPGRRLPRLPRLPVHRLVTGVVAAGLVGVAVVATATTPPYVPPVDACERPAAGSVTRLPGGVSAYADEDGWLCGNPVRTYAVDGSDLRVWSASSPSGD